MRIMDALMGFPMLVLALLLAAVLRGGIQNVIIALAIATLPAYTRLMCGETLSVKENEYIMAQRAMGGKACAPWPGTSCPTRSSPPWC